MSDSVQVPVAVSPARIEKHGSLLVAGVSQVYKLGDDFTPLWDELNQKASPAMLDILAVTQYIGVCTQPSTDGFVRYTAGILVDDRASAHKLGLGLLDLPASTYAVVEVTGPISRSIPAGFESFEREFFASAVPPARRPGGVRSRRHAGGRLHDGTVGSAARGSCLSIKRSD